MTKEDIQLLFEYDRWANNRVLQAASTLTVQQFTRDLGGSFHSVRDTLVHIIGGTGGAEDQAGMPAAASLVVFKGAGFAFISTGR